MNHSNIIVFRGIEGFENLRIEWQQIFSEITDKHLFQSYEWHKSYIETQKEQPFEGMFLARFENGTPAAILPFEKIDTQKSSLDRLPQFASLNDGENSLGNALLSLMFLFKVFRFFRINFRILQIPHCHNADYGDFICSVKAGMLDVIDCFDENTMNEWDLIILPHILEGSSADFLIRNSMHPFKIVESGDKYQILSVQSYEKIWKGLSRKYKKAIRLARNRFLREKNAVIKSIREAEALPQAFHDFIELEASGWKGKAGTAIKNNTQELAFFENLMTNFALNSNCEINLLIIDGKSVAALFCLQVGETIYTLKVGYNERYAHLSPGILLLDDLIKRCCEDPCITNINFISRESYSAKWRPALVKSYNIILFNKSFRGQLCRLVIRWEMKAKCYSRLISPTKRALKKMLKSIKKNLKSLKNSINSMVQNFGRAIDYYLVPFENRIFEWYVRRHPDKFRKRLDACVEKGMEYLKKEDSLMFDVLFTFTAIINKTFEPQLEHFETKLIEYHQKWKDPHLRLLDKNYDPDKHGVAKANEVDIEKLYPVEKPMLKCLYADKLELSDDYLTELNTIDDSGGYGTTHVLLGCAILKTFSSISHDELDKRINSAVSSIIKSQKRERISDIFSEKTALLLWSGYERYVKTAWIVRIMKGQIADGGWFQFRTIYRKKSHQHPTCVALASLIHYRERILKSKTNGAKPQAPKLGSAYTLNLSDPDY